MGQVETHRLRPRAVLGDAWLAILLLLPLMFTIFGVIGVPFMHAIVQSFTDKRVGFPGHFVWLQNYRELLRDPVFWIAVRNSALYAVIAVAVKLVAGFVMALVLDKPLSGRSLWRALILLPWAIPALVAALTWRWMYSDTNGVINSILLRSGLIDYPIPWLAAPSTALISVIMVNVWKGVPFFTFTLLGGLQGIDRQLYEAAAIDGATGWQQTRHVTIPGVFPVALTATLLSLIWTFNDFQTVFVMTGGGPGHATTIVATLTYEYAFWNLELGKAVAVSVAVAPVFVIGILALSRLISSGD